MPATVENSPELQIAQDDHFQALEGRIVRAIELLKSERAARASSEQQNSELSQRAQEQTAHISRLEGEISGLKKERDAVRQRVERLLGQLEDL